ncbi:MAG: type II secretion system F family protein, partial [Chloroflexi bacterium]|nr:type II secretion system F family protein [Chloroflexota bacterium]
LSLLIGAGVPLTEALTLTVQTTGNGTLKAALISCQAQVNAGQSFSQAIASDPIFPVLVSQMVAVGESTGHLDTNLEAVADFYDMDSARATEGVLTWIGPVMIIGVGLVVGVVAVTLFSSIYSASGMLK